MEQPKRKRGPYKQYLQYKSTADIPRKTRNNWVRRLKEKGVKKFISAIEDCGNIYLRVNQKTMKIKSSHSGDQHGETASMCQDEQTWNEQVSINTNSENSELSMESCDSSGGLANETLNDNLKPSSLAVTQARDDGITIHDTEERSKASGNNASNYDDTLENGTPVNPIDDVNCSQSSRSATAREDTGEFGIDRGDSLQGWSHSELVYLLVVLATKMRHNSTYCCVEDMSEMIEIMKKHPEKPLTKYKYQKVIKQLSTSLSVHHFCPKCNGYGGKQKETGLMEGDNAEGILTCRGCSYEIDIAKNMENNNTFLYLSLSSQLAEFFSRHGARILYSSEREKERKYAIEDIYDGRLYKKNFTDDMISINFSVDGVPIFNSSNYGMCPLTCTINELSPEKRSACMLLCSLYCGPGKVANINAFLTPFIEECNELYTSGFNYTYKGQIYRKKCRILCGICDSIARREVRNITQFNGQYGCGFCKNPGKQLPKGNGFVRIYAAEEDGDAFGEGLRTHNETLEHTVTLEKGIQGRSILFDAHGVDVIQCLTPEWQHNVGLGVVRQFSNLWFNSNYHDEPFYCGRKIKLVDSILLSFKPSLDVSRTPRKMSERAFWKAHEWVIFLLFYSLPVLQRVLPRKYLYHWALLVDAISILVSTSIMPTDLYYAENCLRQFVQGIPELYGEEHLSYNVHLLLHLPQSVLNWGPLWTHSAFGYENSYQQLLNFVHSSNSPGLQIFESFQLHYVVLKLYDICEPYMTEFQLGYLQRIIQKKSFQQSSLRLKSVTLLGRGIVQKLLMEDFLALKRIDVDIELNTIVRYYQRMILNRQMFHSASYVRPTKRQSYFVITQDSEIFEIQKILVHYGECGTKCYAIGYFFIKQQRSFIANKRLSHMTFLAGRAASLAAVPMDSIKEKVVFIEMKNCGFIVACRHPNHCELLT